MTVYRELDNTVKMHLDAHFSIQTSQRDDFVLFSYCSHRVRATSSRVPFEQVLKIWYPTPPRLRKKLGTKLRFLRKENLLSMLKRRFEKIAVERR